MKSRITQIQKTRVKEELQQLFLTTIDLKKILFFKEAIVILILLVRIINLQINREEGLQGGNG